MKWAIRKISVRCAITLTGVIGVYPMVALAGPKEDCQLVVQSLGLPIDGYSYIKGGIFTDDRHVFGSLTCYVNADGSFDSLYQGDTVIAEDGYFGTSALAARDAAREKAKSAEELAAQRRDDAISKAWESYELESKKVSDGLFEELSKLREASDPFRISVAVDAAEPILQAASPDSQVALTDEKTTGSSSVDSAGGQPDVASTDSAVAGIREMWVSAERLNIRSCASEKCGRTGWALSGEKLTIYEVNGEWGRISEPTDAFCEDGWSAQIDDGDRRCVPENGVTDGHLARWVSLRHLAEVPPEPASDPEECSSGFLASSDNYEIYAREFCAAAVRLIAERKCTERDFKESGGWWASTTHPKGTFFTYCGGMALSNKIYLDARTGRIFQ